MILSFLLKVSLIAQVDYGEIYVQDESLRTLPRIALHTGYAFDLDDSFNELHSLTLQAQVGVWKYISTGVLYQHVFAQLSDAGKELEALEPSLDVSIPQQTWGLFSLTQFQLINGEWNIMNSFPLRAELLIGGGLGMLRERKDIRGSEQNMISYLWSAEQRFSFYDHYGVFLHFFGQRSAHFLATGLSLKF